MSSTLQTPISVVATNLRPFTNKDPTNDVVYKHGLPRPIKGYRLGYINAVTMDPSAQGYKYLQTNMNRYVRSSRSTNLMALINRPGHVTESISNANFASDVKSDLSVETDNNCCEEKKALKLARGASTNLSKNYYQTEHQYRQSRCKTLYQKSFNYTRDNGTTYVGNCPTCNKIIYKPNNAQYSTQGGVSSSSRTTRLILNTIKTDVNGLKSKATADNFSNPSGSISVPFILKSKSDFDNLCRCVPGSLNNGRMLR